MALFLYSVSMCFVFFPSFHFVIDLWALKFAINKEELIIFVIIIIIIIIIIMYLLYFLAC
jgi:hypothetical protein